MASTPRRRKRSDRIVETEDYVAFLHRSIDALGRRLADDPAGLVHVEPLRDHLRDAMNTAIALNQAAEGGTYSFGELAAILGVARPSVYERATKGRKILAAVRARLGVVDLRAHRKARLDAAGVPDRRRVA